MRDFINFEWYDGTYYYKVKHDLNDYFNYKLILCKYVLKKYNVFKYNAELNSNFVEKSMFKPNLYVPQMDDDRALITKLLSKISNIPTIGDTINDWDRYNRLQYFDLVSSELLFEFNLKNPIHNDWRMLSKFLIFIYNNNSYIARKSFKCLRELYFSSKMKNWYDVLPNNIVEWAYAVIDDLISSESLYCADNYRVANAKKSSQVRRYKKQIKNGCCGRLDTKMVGPDGNIYLIGLNYGH